METILATCPHCHVRGTYGAELVGRYTLCTHCHTRFYVEVPTLAETERGRQIEVPATTNKAPTTLDDLLWDTQQGARHIIESLRRQEALAKLNRWLLLLAVVLALANLIGIAVSLLR